MTPDNTQPQEGDLDRTDRLPMLAGTIVDEDVEDDAVRLDYSPVMAGVKSELARAAGAAKAGGAAPERAPPPRTAGVPRAAGTESARLRTLLEAEQARSRELERVLAEKRAAVEAARLRLEETLREAERYQNESQTLRNMLAAREVTLGQVQRSLAERDTQLSALQREHAQVVPMLEERSRLSTQLEAELHALQARYESISGELKNAQRSLTTLTVQLEAGKEELDSTRRELNLAKLQAATYLEHLRTREWRRGFDCTGTAHDSIAQHGDSAALRGESERLRAREAELESKLAMRDDAIANLKAAAMDDEAQRSKELESVADKVRAELSAQVKRLQVEAQTREEENAVLLAHLREARRPVESTATDNKRLKEELAAKTRALELLNEDYRSLHVALERARSSLKESEFLIRRLERGETGAAVAAPVECTAELVRIDGQHNTTHALARRTRIGRAPGCELRIESTSVSRHHALLHVSSNDVTIEDLNSTNGVLVNGRRISRQPLNDGDVLTIGEARFRLSLKLASPQVAGRG